MGGGDYSTSSRVCGGEKILFSRAERGRDKEGTDFKQSFPDQTVKRKIPWREGGVELGG